MSVSLNGTNGLTFNDASTQNTSAFYGGLAMRNRIINGAMVIDQRNAGASVTPADLAYTLDRWQSRQNVASKYSVQQSSTAPAGFNNSLLVTSLSAYSVGSTDVFYIRQNIEGFNFADMAWGTANAKAVTLSFQVYSSLTGTFGGALNNSAVDRSYPFSYSIPVANTWTTISVTVAGDTSGTWIGATNGIGLRVVFSLGVGSPISGTAGAWATGAYYAPTGSVSVVGTSGATFYITGVQLEKGSTATSFDYRPYSTELSLCQRYYETNFFGTAVPTNSWSGAKVAMTVGTNTYAGGAGTAQQVLGTYSFNTTKRAAPTINIYSAISSTLTAVSNGWTAADFAANSGGLNYASVQGFSIYNATGGNISTGGYSVMFNYSASSEL